MLPSSLTASTASTDLARYQTDPVGYATEYLDLTLTPDQEEMLRSVCANRYTAVKASHAIGKTFVAAVAACWWYDCWPEHIVYVTAPTWPQALGLTFKQIKRLRRARNLPGDILETGLVRDTDKDREGAHFIRALNAESGEGFQGEHSAPILIIKEEAVGVPVYIWEAAGGLMTHPACRTLDIANPTDEANPFGQACESPQYNVLSVSALEHPNIAAELACEDPPFPDAVRLQWLYEMLETECQVSERFEEDAFEWWSLEAVRGALNGRPVTTTSTRSYYVPTAYFQGRVLGEFPTQADEQVIPKGWLRDLPTLELEGDAEIGCDVARFGNDRTTIGSRRGPCVLRMREIRQLDNEAVIVALKDEAKWLAEQFSLDPKKIVIRIDVTGGLGTGPYDRLKSEGYNAVAVNSSESPRNQELYRNKRSELWFDVRDRARTKRLDLSRLHPDIRRRLIKELTTPKYKVLSGKKVVEEKADIKKRLMQSPDLADGFNLMFANYAPAPAYSGRTESRASALRW